MGSHRFEVAAEWLGNRGEGTSGYRSYGREVMLRSAGLELAGSAATAFFGNADRWNPEQLLVGALVQCHLLSYLHVAARHGIRVEAYTDAADGTMEQVGDGGRFLEVTLRPAVRISAGDPELALALHDEAAELCFIASSVNFPVRHEPSVELAAASTPLPE